MNFFVILLKTKIYLKIKVIRFQNFSNMFTCLNLVDLIGSKMLEEKISLFNLVNLSPQSNATQSLKRRERVKKKAVKWSKDPNTGLVRYSNVYFGGNRALKYRTI